MTPPAARMLVAVILCSLLLAGAVFGLPALAEKAFGPAAPWLTLPQLVQYSAKLLWADGLLTRPPSLEASDVSFSVRAGEGVDSVCSRLEQAGVVVDGRALRDYLIYTGQDTTLQAGQFQLSARMSAIEVARQMQDATPADVVFVVLPGWRIEEIAAGLPTSGLSVSPDEFIRVAHSPRPGYDFLAGASTTEGFLFPDQYVLSRTTAVEALLDALIRNFAQRMSADLKQGFAAQGLSVYEATTLASIVEREAVREEEATMIASVYLNRLRQGMRLDADPTVQYALGFNAGQQTWWTNPLSLDDLKIASAYNTYRIEGLPPAPIANPGPESLQAVASPAISAYFFFSARCDGSGYHVFAASFEEHLGNLCE